MKKTLLVLVLLSSFQIYAQEQDSIAKKKNMRFSILGGPGYTPDYGFLLGGSALFTFSTEPENEHLKRSVLPVAFAYMTAGGGSMIIRPQLFFNNDRFRIFGTFSMNNTIDNYYGVGFDKNTDTERGSETTEYRSIGYRANPIFLFRFLNTDLFYGASFDINQNNIQDPSTGVQNDPDYIAQGGTTSGLKFLNVGVGINLRYDTRDVPANSFKGMLIEIGASRYDEALGSSNSFSVYNLEYRQFKSLGSRKVIAWLLKGDFTTGNTPITNLSILGSPYDLRGYYKGQYRDNHTLASVVEYRQMLPERDETKTQRILSKLGFAAWIGAGTIGPEMNNWEGFAPNFGAGLRIEVQPRMNFRIDFGHDPINNQTLMYFNMTEAF